VDAIDHQAPTLSDAIYFTLVPSLPVDRSGCFRTGIGTDAALLTPPRPMSSCCNAISHCSKDSKDDAMSFTTVEPVASRLNRSELAGPCSRTELFEKAAKGAADVVFLDLEDAVAPDDKERARKNCIQALNEVDWRGKTLSLRINGLDTHWMYRDVVDVLEG